MLSMKTPEKLISSAMIVIAAAILIAVGALVRHSDTRLFVMFLGCAVGAAGMYGWISAFFATSKDH